MTKRMHECHEKDASGKLGSRTKGPLTRQNSTSLCCCLLDPKVWASGERGVLNVHTLVSGWQDTMGDSPIMLQKWKRVVAPKVKGKAVTQKGKKKMLDGRKPNANNISFTEPSMEICPLIVHTQLLVI